ncbi:DUF6928 family protein [Gordonia humi]|uniref:Uncharacterized protein n=1 Tax=Gordonia humi TaxID=686429 RepID=A0A840F115_9ACTN|nr:hypothetical protein [Gordonia humi]MBB4135039.1 hypothetical protein [Gordonia humi]
MFAHTTALWFVDCPDPAEQLRRGPVADPDRTDAFIATAYADDVPSASALTDLSALSDAADDVVFAAHFGDLAVLAGKSLSTVAPDELTEFVTGLGFGQTVLLLSLDPVASTGVFARWENGRLQRAFAASPDTIRADHGVPFPFENGFWAGERPLQYLPGVEPNPLDLPFHPAELAEESNRQWLGFRFTPPPGDDDTALTSIPVYSYRILSAGSESVPAADAEPVAPPPAEAAAAGPSRPADDLDDAEVTTPLARASESAPEPTPRAPGPISRYFGFRGRL